MAVDDAYVFPGFLSPVLTQLFFPKPPTTFPTCFCRGERQKYAGKKSRLNRGSNSQPPGHESDTLTTEPLGRSTIFCPSHWLFSLSTIVETMDSGGRGMHPVAITIIKRILAKLRIKPATSCSQVWNATDWATGLCDGELIQYIRADRLKWGLTLSKQALAFMCLQYKSFENSMGKREIARNKQFFLFPQCFLPFWRTFHHFHQT